MPATVSIARMAEEVVLDANRGQVEKLALALLEHGRLTGRQVSEVLCNGAPSKQAA